MSSFYIEYLRNLMEHDLFYYHNILYRATGIVVDNKAYCTNLETGNNQWIPINTQVEVV